MILIGICGESGSGKTLTSEIIARKLNCQVYHLDNLQKEVEVWKRKSFVKKFTVPTNDSNGDEIVVIDPKFKGKRMSSKAVENLYEKVKMSALKSIIMKRILKQRMSKAKYFIIEGTQLPVYISLNMLDIKILMNREFSLRQKDVIKRDNISEEEFEAREEYDKPKIQLCKGFKNVINNNGTKDDLEAKIEDVLNREIDNDRTI
ncbi:MAG: dephospho-CoA kinase [Clostridiales bacterium]|nr:dephospho-CoA kinase [Clostridiales bacterium]